MNYEKPIIQSFTQLYTWQKGHELVLMIYALTKEFPSTEIYGLTNQLRRAAVSITSNISEGFSRQSYKEKIHFYTIALGSLTEVQNQLLIAKDIQYLSDKIFIDSANLTVIVSKLLNGLIKASKQRI